MAIESVVLLEREKIVLGLASAKMARISPVIKSRGSKRETLIRQVADASGTCAVAEKTIPARARRLYKNHTAAAVGSIKRR